MFGQLNWFKNKFSRHMATVSNRYVFFWTVLKAYGKFIFRTKKKKSHTNNQTNRKSVAAVQFIID